MIMIYYKNMIMEHLNNTLNKKLQVNLREWLFQLSNLK